MKKLLSIIVTAILLTSCGKQVEEINIGFIGPLTERAIDLGIGPAKALELAIKEYNGSKDPTAPKINLFVEDDQWEKEKALPAYEKLSKEHNIQVLFISNTGGTIALQEKVLKDGVIMINQLNSDALLSALNRNTFKIAKRTEDAHEVIGARIAELGLKNLLIYHFPNDFMTRGAKSVESVLKDNGISYKTIEIIKGQTDFKNSLSAAKNDNVDGICFFGYRNFGFAMKQAREMGIDCQFFGSTTLFDPIFYDNSEGTIVGTECTYFTEKDGNYVLAHEFIEKYEKLHLEKPGSIWPAMQAYDAGNITIGILATINEENPEKFDDWLRQKLHRVNYYQGVCGNISIGPDGASKGIYFSIYRYADKGVPQKIKR